jgi:hypothetical protein
MWPVVMSYPAMSRARLDGMAKPMPWAWASFCGLTAASVGMPVPPSSVITASATARKASASRARRCDGVRHRGPGQAGTRPEKGLHDRGIAGLAFDLAAQVPHVQVSGSLIPFGLIAAHPVDQLQPRVRRPDRGQRDQDAPFGRGQGDH